LSISGEEGFPSLGFSPVVVGRVLEMLGSRVSIRWPKLTEGHEQGGQEWAAVGAISEVQARDFVPGAAIRVKSVSR